MADDRKWFWVRLGLVVAGGLSGISITSPKWWPNRTLIGWLVWSCCWPLRSDSFSSWASRRSTLCLHPCGEGLLGTSTRFFFKEPLQFFHLGAFHFIAGRLVGVTTLPLRGASAAPLAVSLLSTGAGAWLGVPLCMLCFRRRWRKANFVDGTFSRAKSGGDGIRLNSGWQRHQNHAPGRRWDCPWPLAAPPPTPPKAISSSSSLVL